MGGRVVRHRAGYAKVHDLNRVVFTNHDIGRLYVSVNHSGAVRYLKGAEDSRYELHRTRGFDLALVNQISKESSFNKLHDDERGFDNVPVCIGGLFLTGIVDADN